MLPGLDANPLRRESRKQAQRAQSAIPVGTILPYGGSTAPAGFAMCDGTALSRTKDAALYAVIGTTYGVGDGSTTYNTPNLVNRFPVGAGGLYASGATGGSKDAIAVSHTHTATVTDPSHGHGVTDGTHAHTVLGSGGGGGASGLVGNDGGGPTGGADSSFNGSNISVNSSTTGITVGISTTGSSGTNANLPPYLGVNYIIKT